MKGLDTIVQKRAKYTYKSKQRGSGGKYKI